MVVIILLIKDCVQLDTSNDKLRLFVPPETNIYKESYSYLLSEIGEIFDCGNPEVNFLK